MELIFCKPYKDEVINSTIINIKGHCLYEHPVVARIFSSKKNGKTQYTPVITIDKNSKGKYLEWEFEGMTTTKEKAKEEIKAALNKIMSIYHDNLNLDDLDGCFV